MAAKEKTLSDAFYETLKDVYWAEKQGTRALGRAAKAAKDPALKQAFEHHREESAHQIERLEQVFEIVGKTARAKTCEAMKGIAEEMSEDLEDFGDTAAADAVLIGCAQAVEHYEISRYGTLKTWAKHLGFAEAEKLLGETLEEEKKADEALSAIAAEQVNAAGGQGEMESDEDEAEEDEEARGELKGPKRRRVREGLVVEAGAGQRGLTRHSGGRASGLAAANESLGRPRAGRRPGPGALLSRQRDSPGRFDDAAVLIAEGQGQGPPARRDQRPGGRAVPGGRLSERHQAHEGARGRGPRRGAERASTSSASGRAPR